MVHALPIFNGYTVDVRLRQFRRVSKGQITFVNFDTPEGEKLLKGYIRSLNPGSVEFAELIKGF